ncbi:MAG: dihydroorotase [Chitinophagales bacterium]|nr:dihydroorotase [Chitinophagales bacterium]MCB9018930.1 dihydroorotase [Chitinophagales bacterium]HPE98554.1 dihydroorotase [Chitinophagales bacterium]HQU39581.1 dihydroorotase [Chitinophagales bacterium]HQU75396.1 dihydroorotase [Chitinophagales bacterium]
MSTIIRNVRLVNEGQITETDVLIRNGRFEKIAPDISVPERAEEVDASGLHMMPGIIDDQVHFREPGLTWKEDIAHGAKAAVAGGVTSFMEMPNVVPPSFTHELLEEKYAIAARNSVANYSFYLGTSHDNLEEIKRIDATSICGLKIFMGSSTGNLLVDDPKILEEVFRNSPTLIATHCEHEPTVRANTEKYKAIYGDHIPVALHPVIRDEQACYLSSSFAVDLAKKTGARLHILHISTAEELDLFDNNIPLEQKRITAEACVHHLYFDAGDYEELGSRIKWNPAVKDARHKPQILQAVLDDRIDVIATDHAPHTLEEKSNPYTSCPSGAPMVQHSINVMLSFYHQGRISLEQIAAKMSHDVARCFRMEDRGYIREGYHADFFLLDPDAPFTVTKESLLYKCGWSPLEGFQMQGKVHQTYVNGQLVWNGIHVIESANGERLRFRRLA